MILINPFTGGEVDAAPEAVEKLRTLGFMDPVPVAASEPEPEPEIKAEKPKATKAAKK